MRTSSSDSPRHSSAADSLLVVLYGQQVGTLAASGRSDAGFAYSPSYLDRGVRPQLSMRMPLQAGRFPSARTMPFLDGLLPENRETRREKARALGIGDDVRSLLAVMGWDCPGAVQITPPN